MIFGTYIRAFRGFYSMRIVVNDIAASGGGALTVLEGFYTYVRDVDRSNDWVFLLGSQLLHDSQRIRTVVLPEVKNSWLERLRFDLFWGRRLIAELQPDVLFSLQNTYTYGVACPQVVYVHQSLPFQRATKFSLRRREERSSAIYQHIMGSVIRQSIRQANRVIVQSEWMRNAILDQVEIPVHRVETVVPDLEDLSAYKFEGPFDSAAFFYPTADSLYKNNTCIYEACRFLRHNGISNFSVTMTLDPPTRDPNVVAIGRVPRDRVLEILSRSTLIFASLSETYGLPLAEARALGARVLSADLPYAREALDGYRNAYFFDPRSPEQLAELMTGVLRGELSSENPDQVFHGQVQTDGLTGWSAVARIIEGCAREGARVQ